MDEVTCLEMSPQYHSASCSAMLLFIPLLVTGVGLGGFGGRAVQQRHKKKTKKIGQLTVSSYITAETISVFQHRAYKIKYMRLT